MQHEKKSKPFIMNFVALIQDKQLTPTNREVFSFIYALTQNGTGYCYATDRYIADHLNVSPSTIQKSIHILKENGYITIKHIQHESGYGAFKRYIYINEHKLYCTSKI